MDFFQAQDAARKKTKWLVLYFLTAVVLIVAVVYVVVLIAFGLSGNSADYGAAIWWRPDVLVPVAIVTCAVIAGGTALKTLALRGGGGAVARSVGGTIVDPHTTNPDERRLLNIVEEMAIASGVRVPEVYVLPEAGINAFAAGFSPDDAAVTVTQGALATLNRDELQGVIAHEFSHILNGDMRLNVRLIGLLFGILLLALIGRGLVQSLRFSRVSGRGKGSGGVIAGILLLGLALIIIGYVGVLFGRLIQAAVSRQREFLADASAVQFTRNPSGLAGALKKIGGLAAGSRVGNAHAAEASHLFFANALEGTAFNLFATHPPLAERIRAIDPSFDGKFEPVEPRAIAAESSSSHATPRPSRGAMPPPLRPEQFVTAVATLDTAHAASGAAVIAAIPEPLRAAAHDPARARPLVLALLLSSDDASVATRQRDALAAALTAAELVALTELAPLVQTLPASGRLPLVDLALPSIRRLAQPEIDGLITAMEALIAADNRTTLFEFALRQVVTRYLRPLEWTADRAGAQVFSYIAFADDIAVLLSALAYASASEPVAIHQAFAVGASQLGLIRDRLALQQPNALSGERMTAALANLERAAAPIKQRLLAALARTAAADGTIKPGEAELLRAVAAGIDWPAPPLAT